MMSLVIEVSIKGDMLFAKRDELAVIRRGLENRLVGEIDIKWKQRISC
jgi:hypothetical protein